MPQGDVEGDRHQLQLARPSPASSTRGRLAIGYSRLLRYAAKPLLQRVEVAMATQYEQVEALIALYASLDIRRPLPPLRGSRISPDFARELVLMVLDTKPATIVELGSGASTVVAGYALRKNAKGNIISLDHEACWYRKSSALVRAHGLDDVATVVHAPLRIYSIAGASWTWYDMAALEGVGPIDLMLVDGPPTGQASRYPALPLLHERLSPAAVIMLDDATRPEEVEVVRRWTEEFGPFAVDYFKTETGLSVLRSQTLSPPHAS